MEKFTVKLNKIKGMSIVVTDINPEQEMKGVISFSAMSNWNDGRSTLITAVVYADSAEEARELAVATATAAAPVVRLQGDIS